MRTEAFKRIVFGIVFAVALTDCGDGKKAGAHFIGNWKNDYAKLTILDEGDGYLVERKYTSGVVKAKYHAKLKDGELELDGLLYGNVSYSKEKDTIHFFAGEFQRY